MKSKYFDNISRKKRTYLGDSNIEINTVRKTVIKLNKVSGKRTENDFRMKEAL